MGTALQGQSECWKSPPAPNGNNDFNGLKWRRLDVRPVRSAICPRESVLPIRLRPDFSVIFEGYAGGAEHRPRRQEARKQSLRADILQTS